MKANKYISTITKNGIITNETYNEAYFFGATHKGCRLLKKAQNNRYRIELYENPDADYRARYIIVFIDNTDRTEPLPFFAKSYVSHYAKRSSINMIFKNHCREIGIESYEVSKHYKRKENKNGTV